MKKIIIISTLLLMSLGGTAFAGNLDGMESGLVNLSQGVFGTYFATATDNTSTDFVISTGHAQGGFVYGTGSFTTSIFREAIAGDSFASGTDLVTSKPSSFEADSVFSGWSAI